MSKRSEKIREMLARAPDDVFLHYSLAMELVSAQEHQHAMEAFHKCMDLDNSYFPAYVEAGKCLLSMSRTDQAREMFDLALKLATQQGQTHVVDSVRQHLKLLSKHG